MSKFLVDANLPLKIKTWQNADFEFVVLINDEWTDDEIWNYAIENHLIIITKDTDFSHRIMVSNNSPNVIHIKVGNMKLRELEKFIFEVWREVEELCESHKLINVFFDRIEGIK
jgi:predicted nuclease of predicted toxin-antitoxin system